MLTVENERRIEDNESIGGHEMAKKDKDLSSDAVVEAALPVEDAAIVDAVVEIKPDTSPEPPAGTSTPETPAEAATPAVKNQPDPDYDVEHRAAIDVVQLAKDVKVLRAAVRMLAASKSPSEAENFFTLFPDLKG
jgi:hypothetical protein